jgi:RHS repeat-associated protein
MGRYLERYLYDEVGNFIEMKHVGSDPAHPGWSRSYAYEETSLIEDGSGETLLKTSNRLSNTTIGNGNPITECYIHDSHGNMISMPQLKQMEWDCKDQLRMTQRQVVNDQDEDGKLHKGERTYYVYDSAGQRVRKVTENSNGVKQKERIYLGGFELYREYNGNASPKPERQTLHIMDDKQRIALVETRTKGIDPGPEQLIRYQFGNHLGSASLELDEQAQIISYEEYAPYGSSTYQAVHSQTETAKRYRYTGKERDQESGLYYHGARYYTPWLCRWIHADPLGLIDGVNLYSYVWNNPTGLHDPTGFQSEQPEWRYHPGNAPRGKGHEQEAKAYFEQKDNIRISTIWWDSKTKDPGTGRPGVWRFTKQPAEAIVEPQLSAEEQKPESPVSATALPQFDTSLHVGHGIVYQQYSEALREAGNPDNPWWARTILFGLATLTSPLALGEEYVGRPLANIPFNASMAGQFAARASLRPSSDTLGKVEDYSMAVGLFATATASSLSVVAPLAGGAPASPSAAGTPPPLQLSVKPLNYREGFELGYANAEKGLELVLGKYPGNVQYVTRTPGTVTLDVPAGWTPTYNAGYVRGYLEAGGKLRFTSQTFTGTFGLEARQVLGIPGAPW